MKLAIMIPARAGSKRVKSKNIRLLSGKPLIAYVLETLKDIGDPIYVNSDCDIVLGLAQEYGAIPYRRDASLATDTATNDDFAMDFINKVGCEYLLQVLSTSPFVTQKEITGFRDHLLSGEVDTLVSVRNEQIGCVYKGVGYSGPVPLNFSKTEKNPPSQTMEPVQAYATSLMGWKCSMFVKNYDKFGCAYHGGIGKTEYYELKGFSTFDIDNEEDFMLAETIAQFLPFRDRYVPMYYTPSHIDFIVPHVMKDDGVKGDSTADYNQPVVNIFDILKDNSDAESWYKTLINTENNSCTLVNQMPGEGNRRHYHSKWNEWWYIIQGQWKFDIEDKSYMVKTGDLVFIEKGSRHKITAMGDSMSSRLAVSRYDVEHIYEKVN